MASRPRSGFPLNEEAYFIAEETLLKVPLRLVPRPCIAVMAATAIRAAIKPYSMGVAPFLSLISLRMNISGLLGSTFLAEVHTSCPPALGSWVDCRLHSLGRFPKV